MSVEDHPSVFNTYWVEDNMGYVQKKKKKKSLRILKKKIIFFKDTKAVVITLIQHKY